jgi:hypothetical protein
MYSAMIVIVRKIVCTSTVCRSNQLPHGPVHCVGIDTSRRTYIEISDERTADQLTGAQSSEGGSDTVSTPV